MNESTNPTMISTSYPKHERLERARWMRINAQAVATFGESRQIDKIFEAFEYAFEDVIIDSLGIPPGDDDEENSQAMDIVYDVLHELIKSRYNLRDTPTINLDPDN